VTLPVHAPEHFVAACFDLLAAVWLDVFFACAKTEELQQKIKARRKAINL
jgi:hypothetical protein